MNQEEKIAFGKKVRKFRLERGLSQRDLAEGICHESTVCQLEKGIFTPSGKILQKICERLSISSTELLENHVEKLEVDAVLDIIKIHIQREEYNSAADLIETLKNRDDLAKYQKHQLIICESDYLIRTGGSEEAIKQLQELEKTLIQERDPDKQLLATVLNKLGTACYRLSSMIEAYHYYSNAHTISKEHLQFDVLPAEICYNLGNTCRRLGKYEEGLYYVKKARDFFEQSSDLKKYAQTLFSLGLTYRSLKNLEQAGWHLQKSLHLYESLHLFHLAEEVRYAYAYLILTEVDPNKAIEGLLTSAEEEGNLTNIASRAYSYALAASIYMEQGDLVNAKTYLDKALELFIEKMAEYDPKYVCIYHFYAKYLLANNDLDKCVELAKKAAQLFGKMGFERDAAESLILLKEAYHKRGDMDLVIQTYDQIVEKLQNTLGKRTFLERG